jgi:N-acetylglucosaminyl-diphospho-decaprenol L-rhamnosyltransferase
LTLAKVVIVHYGEIDQTLKLSNSMIDWDVEITVIANDLKKRPTKLNQKVVWFEPDRNLGYAGAINTQLDSHSNIPLVVMNPDVLIKLDSFLQCLQTLNNKDIGIVGPQIVNELNMPQRCLGQVSRILKMIKSKKITKVNGYLECEWIVGAIMFISPKVYNTLKFDESFFLGFEDVDYCINMKKITGLKVVVPSKASAIHVGSTSIGKVRWYYFNSRNAIWFSHKQGGPVSLSLNMLYQLIRLLRFIIIDTFKYKSYNRSGLFALGIIHSFSKKNQRFLPRYYG